MHEGSLVIDPPLLKFHHWLLVTLSNRIQLWHRQYMHLCKLLPGVEARRFFHAGGSTHILTQADISDSVSRFSLN